MSATDDDLRQALAQAAGEVSAPSDPVGRVRAAVDRRRRRRTRTRIAAASASAAGVLVAAVVLAPGQLPRDDAAPPATSPSPSASEGAVGALLGPDGLDGLRLGEPVEGLDGLYLRGDPEGCQGGVLDLSRTDMAILGSAGAGATELTAWVQDGVLVRLDLVARPDRVELPGDTPRTWLGPTLRSPLSSAVELPGARRVVDEPAGGPPVSSVVVELEEGSQLVYAAVPVGARDGDGGQITAVVLRSEVGRGCSYDPSLVQPGQGLPDQAEPVALGAGGLAGVPLGSSVAEAVASGAVVAEVEDPPGFGDPLDRRGCVTYRSVPDQLTVWADGDRVVGVATQGFGPSVVLASDPPVRSGQPFDEVAARPGAVPASTATGFPSTTVDLQVAPGVRARVTGVESVAVLETSGLIVPGTELVDGVLVYQGDAPADSLCTP